jgi:hypothetical protein
VSLNSARAKARDARRLSDIKQIRTALEMYFDSNMSYPDGTTTTTTTLGVNTTACLTSAGWVSTSSCTGIIYMQKVPSDPQPTRSYQYSKVDATHYRIAYYLEGSSATKTATESSMD